MDVMMRRTTQAHNRSLGGTRTEYLEQTAHSVEVRREVNEKGELGTYGFILVQERPPIVGTIVPGGPADRAGLKKNEVVVAVNNNDVTNCPHKEVAHIITNNPSSSIWLTVCEPADPSRSHAPSHGPSMGRVSSLGVLSASTPSVNGNFPEPRRMYANDDSPPRYFDVTRNQPRTINSYSYASTSSINVSPLTQVYRPNHNGLTRSDQTFPPKTTSSPTPSPSAFTSANVLVLYIGAVEIPLSWRVRELSSRCLQECTRQLLSQRQEFLEVFLDVNLKSLKILRVDQAPLFSHPREELFYCGVCTNDEQYFGIVTKKEQKSTKKGGQSNGHQPRAHMCHVFKVMQSKSVLVLKTGDVKVGPKGKSISTTVKPKTIPIVSCVTIINALQGLFTSEDLGGSKLFSESPSLRGSSDQSLKVGPSLSSFSSGGSGGSNESVSSPEKTKKLDVVDLRPTAYTPKSRSLLTQSLPQSNPNTYVTPPQHSRSLSKEDFPLSSMATPAFLHQRQGSGNGTWYSADSPKENRHSRENSWDNRESRSRPVSGSFEKYTVHVPQSQHTTSGSSGGRMSGGSAKHGYGIHGFDQLSRKISDDSSISSLSDSRDSPTKLQFVSHSHSRSPSPPQSLSYSSGSGSPTMLRRQRSPSPGPVPRAPAYRTPSVSKLSAGLALETSRRYRAASPASSFVSSRGNLRRQGSESSIMEAHDLSYRTSLPPKNSALTSSIGSVATLTTVADEDVNDPEECGRVGGWVASFDKLLQDPMGVECLLHFLEKEHCEENILFWRDAQAFKLNAPRASSYRESVKKLYDQYLSPSSPSTVNVDDRVLKAVESKLANPPLNIFNEAQEQIYQLMKMDCYPRFKKSDIVKQCLMAEMEGKPLPIDPSPPQKSQESQFNGIWKKHRERGFGRSLFSKLNRKSQSQGPQPPAMPIWGVSPEGKSPDSGKKKKKDSHNRRSTARDSISKAPEHKSKGSTSENPPVDDVRPQDHLDMFQAHKRNVFEVNLPNKVTKIMQVPDDKATVREAIQPVLKKYGYDFDIMELRFANNFMSINLDLSADILIGQHILVAKSKNTFIAAFPDQLDKILPADGSKSVGELFVTVLKEMDKLQNFQVFCEGSRVPLELGVDTSVLVGQRVIVKYLPGPCTFPVSSDMDGMEDLFSKIVSLGSDTLSDQRASPTPHTTPEPESLSPSMSGTPRARSQDDLLDGHSPSMRHRTNSAGKRSPNTSRHLSHKMLTVSKSIGVLGHHQTRQHNPAPGGGEARQNSRNQFKRVQSGSSINSTQKAIHRPLNRSISPPASIGYEEPRRRSNVSPPPPTSKPPPLPKEAKRLSGGGGRAQSTRLSSSAKTDSLSSEGSDLTRNRKHPNSEHVYENRPGEIPQFFPQAHPHQANGPVYVNGSQERHRYTKNRPVNLSSLAKDKTPRSSMMPSPPRDDQHPLDNVVNEAYSHQKKPGQPGQKRNIQGGTNLSSYPWHTAQTAHSRKTGGQLTSSRRRKDLTENSELIHRGNEIIKKDMSEFRSHSDGGSSHSGSSRTPLSPTTHILTLPEDPAGCETFV